MARRTSLRLTGWGRPSGSWYSACGAYPMQWKIVAEHWSPKVVGELNGQHVKLVKFQGEFVWHHHDAEDELFLVIRGSFRMQYKDAAGLEQSLDIDPGEFVIVHRGTVHLPVAARAVHVLLF